MNILQLILSILSGIVACIPLAIKLVQYVKLAVKEKNWQHLLHLVMISMQAAENNYVTGETKKASVIKAVEELADSIDYVIDEDELSQLIDDLVTLTKKVNAG